MTPEQQNRIKARLRELAPNVTPELIEAPFNLKGEQIDNSLTDEGEAHVRALAEREARKAQLNLFRRELKKRVLRDL